MLNSTEPSWALAHSLATLRESLPMTASRTTGRRQRLRRVSAAELTIRRVRHGRSFSYRDVEDRPVKDEATLARIRSLAIPPA